MVYPAYNLRIEAPLAFGLRRAHQHMGPKARHRMKTPMSYPYPTIDTAHRLARHLPNAALSSIRR